MYILHLSRFFHSDQTTHILELIREQQRQGHTAKLIMVGCPSYQSLKLYQQKLTEIDAVIINPNDQENLSRQIKGEHFHLIHAHSPLTFHTAADLAKRLGIPFVVTCYELGLNKQEYAPYLQNASAILGVSPQIATNLWEFAAKIQIIPNGVNLEEFLPGEKTEPLKIALVAHIDSSKTKSYTHFCKAVDLLEDVEFYVVSNKNPTSSKARYLGWTNEVSSILARTDIVAGTGSSIIEGLAAGNVAFILGRTYQGILLETKKTAKKKLDLSGLTGDNPCYKTIFFDLAMLSQNRKYLRELQKFGRELAEKEFDNRQLTKKVIASYQQALERK